MSLTEETKNAILCGDCNCKFLLTKKCCVAGITGAGKDGINIEMTGEIL